MSSRCVFKEVYRFIHVTYPLLLLYLLFFAAASLLFVLFFFNVFRSCIYHKVGMSEMLHELNILQTLEYFALGTLSRI